MLELHMRALDVSNADAKTEHSAYASLAEQHRRAAAALSAIAAEMAGYRDLPVAPHDMEAMMDPRNLAAFRELVVRVDELGAQLQQRSAENHAMLAEMERARGD